MTPQEQLVKAEAVARKGHEKQFRRDGITPYIRHVEVVVDKVHSTKEKIVAWLHDYCEDCGGTAKQLLDIGFDNDIVDAVMLLTKTPDYDHSTYIQKIKENALAKTVKIADMRANLADTPTKNQIKRYSNDILYLMT